MLPVDRVVGPPEKLRELEEVLNSRTFARSDQLQRFLRYIIELELAGRGEEISEYSIATDALLRPRDYSPTDDSAVRSRAHALRRKLQEFYEFECPGSELRIEVPKGSYRPLFVARGEPGHTPAVQPLPPAQSKKFALTPLAAFAAGVLVAGVLAVVVHLNLAATRANRLDPVVREAWGALLAPPGEVTILVGSPALAGLISAKADAPPLGLNMFPAPDVLANWYTSLNLSNRGGPVYMFRSRAYTHFGDSLAVVTASTLLGNARVSFQTVPEGLARIGTVQGNGLLAVGSPTYSPSIARVLKATPFSIRYDPALNEEVISDGAPGSTARRVYAPKRDSKTTYFSNVYGLITVLPSQPGRERPERTIIFSGITGSSGAHAAAVFFTSPAAMRDLQRRLRAQGYSRFPPAYQVVVRCGLDGFAALNAVYEAHQVIDRTPVIE
jgi:hypothetical protein